eukprot:3896879-Prymnesium_polylepis.1
MTAVCSAARLHTHKPPDETAAHFADEDAAEPLADTPAQAPSPPPPAAAAADTSKRRKSMAVAAIEGRANVTQVGAGSSIAVAEDHDRIALWMEKLDENHDGSVTYDELLSVVLDHGGTAEQASRIYSRLDVNNDGSISLLEMCDAYSVRLPLLRPARFAQLAGAAAVQHPRSLAYLMTTLWAIATFPNNRAALGRADVVSATLRALKHTIKEQERETMAPAVRHWCLKAAQWAAA